MLWDLVRRAKAKLALHTIPYETKHFSTTITLTQITQQKFQEWHLEKVIKVVYVSICCLSIDILV